MLSSDILSLKI